MRVRKKPDLHIRIPSYPHDYVEMPPGTRRLILEANRTPNDIKYIDDDDDQTKENYNVTSPIDLRSATPEIKITEVISDKEIVVSPSSSGESTLSYNRDFKRASFSVPEFLNSCHRQGVRNPSNSLNVSIQIQK